MVNRCYSWYKLYFHENRHDASVCQLPAVASGGRRLARSARPPPGHCRAVAEATRRCSQGFLELVQAALLGHRQTAQAAAAPGQERRRPGGQPGHPAHQRELFPPELLASTPTDYLLDACPGCGGHLLVSDDEPPILVQQVDLAAVPWEIHEHRSHPGWCPHCRKTCYAPLPGPIQRGGLAGPRLTTVIAYLKGVCHASYSTIRKFMRDVIGWTISRGQLAKIIAKVSRALGQPYEELLQALPDQERLNVDETGHKPNGQPQWIGCFRAGLYTLFKIDPTRSADVLIEVLGAEFDGVLGCDSFSAYRRYHREFGVVLQFCLAHLIRDVKFLAMRPDRRDRAYGERLIGGLRQLFGVIHRRAEFSVVEFQRRLEAARVEVLHAGTPDVPPTRASGNLAKRLAVHGESYFRLLTTWTAASPATSSPTCMGRVISGCSRPPGWNRRTTWRSRRSGSW